MTMWVMGAIIASVGMAVYIEFGTVSFIFVMVSLNLWTFFSGPPSKRCGKELYGIHLQATQTACYILLRYIRIIIGTYFVILFYPNVMIVITQYRPGVQRMQSFSENVITLFHSILLIQSPLSCRSCSRIWEKYLSMEH
jgi:hypothetical protein